MIQYLNPNKYMKLSRYSKIRLINSNTERKPYHEVINDYPKVSVENCLLFEVTPEFENRLDLIAKKHYDDASLWWFLAKQNQLVDPTVIPIGSILEIPRYETLFENGQVLEPMSYLYLNLGVDG